MAFSVLRLLGRQGGIGAARPAFGPLAERSDALAAERAKAWWRRLRSAVQGGPEDLMDPDRQGPV